MAGRNKIEPSIGLTVCISSTMYVPLIVNDIKGDIIKATHIVMSNKHKNLLNLIDNIKGLIEEYKIDTIILEENKLFTDTMGKYPDPYVLNNVLLRYKINNLIEFLFHNSVKYIFELPEQEWRTKILNKHTKYAIDLYKSHILNKISDTEEQMNIYKQFNYYKALCMCESIRYDSLMNTKYQVNKE